MPGRGGRHIRNAAAGAGRRHHSGIRAEGHAPARLSYGVTRRGRGRCGGIRGIRKSRAAAFNVSRAAEVAALYVLKQYQGCGIGRRLFEEAMAATGVPNRIVVWMFRGNARACAFYEHMGFHLTGRTQDVDGVAGAEVELANFDTLVGAAGDPEANGEKLADLARRR